MSNIPSSKEKLARQIIEQISGKQPEEEKPKKEPVEKIIHRIATDSRKLLYDRNRNAYIEVQDVKGLHQINNYLIKVASEEFNEFITHECYTNYFKTPTNQQLKGLKRVVTREAILNGEKIELFNRVASVDGSIYVDLGTADRKMVKVYSSIVKIGTYPIYFQRHLHMEELPEPVPGGDLKELLYYLPPLSEHEQCLVLCWLVVSFIEHIQRPFLLIEGAPGTGKTTLGLILKSLIDPMESAALSFNENENEVAQIIDHQYIPFFDNLTSISRKLSNLMCRAYSGGSHLKKELYTDDKDFILKLSGNIIFSAIKLTKPQNDFLQRCYKVVIEKTDDSNRSREQFAEEFEVAKPRLFGALLETLSKTLAAVDNTQFNKSYRTGDFDRYAATAAEIIGYGADFFWEARARCEQLKRDDIINNTPIIEALTKFLKSNNDFYTGSMSKLRQSIVKFSISPEEIPEKPQALSRRINEIGPELEAAGITATRNSNNQNGSVWTFKLLSKNHEVVNTQQPMHNEGVNTMNHQNKNGWMPNMTWEEDLTNEIAQEIGSLTEYSESDNQMPSTHDVKIEFDKILDKYAKL